jgi:uncharacterized OsmC-like protein
MVLTMSAVAEHKGIQVEKIEVQVEPQIEESPPGEGAQGWHTRFRAQVDIGGGLTARERTILFNSARRCEVHKLLSGQIEFEVEMKR